MIPSVIVGLYKDAKKFLDGYDIRNDYIVHSDLLENNANALRFSRTEMHMKFRSLQRRF